MKALKVLAVILLATFCFQSASAQIHHRKHKRRHHHYNHHVGKH